MYHAFLCHCHVWAPLDFLDLHGSEQRKKHNSSQDKRNQAPQPESWFQVLKEGPAVGTGTKKPKESAGEWQVPWACGTRLIPGETGRIQSPGASNRASGGHTGPKERRPLHTLCLVNIKRGDGSQMGKCQEKYKTQQPTSMRVVLSTLGYRITIKQPPPSSKPLY